MTHANDRQVAGSHYVSEFQHWDYVHHYDLGYYEGQITKYLSRHVKKNGLEDVEKGLHYLEKLTELFRAGEYRPHHVVWLSQVEPRRPEWGDRNGAQWFSCANGLGADETMVMIKFATWSTYEDLIRMRTIITAIRSRYLATRPRRTADIGAEPGPGYVNQDGGQKFVHTSTGLPLDDHYGG